MNIHFGVDYYPEHWPRERWETDARLMREMGVQVVRMGEFSWHRFEPEEGVYQFAWLDEAIELLAGYGIRTIVGTPTAAPPAWMVRKHPDIQPLDSEGRVRRFGGRHHASQLDPVFLSYVEKLVTKMAEHYGKNKNVIGWQPDNELGNSHGDLAHNACFQQGFRRWLEKKYGTVEALNQAWGTAFWSQEYNCFDEVETPMLTAAGRNPSQLLDWKCFHSDVIVAFAKLQTDIIREKCPGQFITHNFMGFAPTVDYYKLAEQLDFVSHDQYPGGFYGPSSETQLAAALDVVRSYKNRSYWIMEQQSGITGWETLGRAPKPGQLSLWTLQSVAHGADAVVYFRWRACAMGTEQYWHGILPHSGNPGRRYAELKETVQAMTPLMERMQGAVPDCQVGIVFSFRQLYAFQIQPQNPKLDYVAQLMKYYEALYRANIPVDFVPEDGDFGQYSLLIAPLQYLMTPELEERYFAYVRQGGHLVLTMRTGVKDASNLCMTERELPGRLGELAGIEVVDYDCLVDTDVKLSFGGRVFAGEKWADNIRLQEARALADYAGEYYAGTPAVTENRFGDGCCWYVGTEPDAAFAAALIRDFAQKAGVCSLGASEPGVELTAKENENGRWLFALNHRDAVASFEVPEGYRLIRGERPGRLEPFEVQIFEYEG